MKKKKNAFTLIELLAIIVILAIIAVITVPIILNIIENSRKGAAIDSAYGFKDAVNKYYVTELSKSENHNLILSGKYDVSAGGVLDGDGIDEVPIPISGDKPSSGKLYYSNNVLIKGCLVIGDYQVIFDGGSVSSTTKGDCSDYGLLAIGDTVNYSTTLNGVTLDDWRVFYIDGDYTYLIKNTNLQTAAISNDLKTSYSLSLGDDFLYCNLDNSINSCYYLFLSTTSNWDDLVINGKINGISINQQVSDNVWAMGSPTIDLWVNSWNDSYPSDVLNATYFTTGNWTSLSEKEGYNDSLYFTGDSYGYYLASLGQGEVIVVDFGGDVCTMDSSTDTQSIRPIIKLPTSVVNQ